MMVECCSANKATGKQDYWSNMGFNVQNTAKTGAIMMGPLETFYVQVEVYLSTDV